MPEMLMGRVTHYFSRIGVAALSLETPLRLGDRIHLLGRTTDLEERVESMEINHRQVAYAQPGDDVAIKVAGKVREGDLVYRVMEEATSGATAPAGVLTPAG